MALTPDEQELLRKLQEKQTEASVTTTDGAGNVFRLIPGGKQEPHEASAARARLQKAKEFMSKIESGEVNEFVLIGVGPDQSSMTSSYWFGDVQGRISLSMLGAIEAIRTLFVRRMIP